MDRELELGNMSAVASSSSAGDEKIANSMMVDVEMNDYIKDGQVGKVEADAAAGGKEEKGLGWVMGGFILFSFTAPSALVGVPVSKQVGANYIYSKQKA